MGIAVVEEELRRDVEDIMRIFRDRLTNIGGRDVKIVDRDREAKAVLGGVSGIDKALSHYITVLYGPKGCGKTTLFSSLVESIHVANRGKNDGTLFEAVMISNEYREEAEKAVSMATSIRWTGGLGEFLKNALKSVSKAILKTVRPTVSLPGVISIGIDPFTIASIITTSVLDRKNLRENGRLLIVIDEARASSEQALGGFRDWLEVFANEVWKADAHYRREMGGKLSVIVLTSDATTANVWYKVGSKVYWALMWNLPRDAFERLANQLGINVERDLLWRLTGGNSRALGDIAETDLHIWLEREIIGRVKLAIKKYYKEHSDNPGKVWSHIVNAAREPLGFLETPLEDVFLESNIVIKILGTPISELPNMPTIGRMNAYQIPAYYYALRMIAKRDASILPKIEEVEIPPEEVIEEARKA